MASRQNKNRHTTLCLIGGSVAFVGASSIMVHSQYPEQMATYLIAHSSLSKTVTESLSVAIILLSLLPASVLFTWAYTAWQNHKTRAARVTVFLLLLITALFTLLYLFLTYTFGIYS